MSAINLDTVQHLFPKYTLPVVLERLQGQTVCRQFFPVRPVAHKQYTWRRFGVVGMRAPKIDENTVPPITNSAWTEVKGETQWYGQGLEISNYVLESETLQEKARFLANSMKTLSDNMIRTQEKLCIDALNNRTLPDWIDQTSGDPLEFDMSTGDKEWAGGTGAVDIYADVQRIKKNFMIITKKPPTDAIVGPDVYEAIMLDPSFKHFLIAGPSQQQPLIIDGKFRNLSGSMGTTGTSSIAGSVDTALFAHFQGINFWVYNMHLADRPEDPESPLSLPFTTDGLMLARDVELANLAVFTGVENTTQPEGTEFGGGFKTWVVPDRRRELQEVFAKMSLEAQVLRGENIAKLLNIAK